jgi:hypothetical protein
MRRQAGKQTPKDPQAYQLNSLPANALFHPAPTHLPVCAVPITEYRSIRIAGRESRLDCNSSFCYKFRF